MSTCNAARAMSTAGPPAADQRDSRPAADQRDARKVARVTKTRTARGLKAAAGLPTAAKPLEALRMANGEAISFGSIRFIGTKQKPTKFHRLGASSAPNSVMRLLLDTTKMVPPSSLISVCLLLDHAPPARSTPLARPGLDRFGSLSSGAPHLRWSVAATRPPRWSSCFAVASRKRSDERTPGWSPRASPTASQSRPPPRWRWQSRAAQVRAARCGHRLPARGGDLSPRRTHRSQFTPSGGWPR